MAELKYCPKYKTSRECTKKGTNAAGEQLWFCKFCGKKFLPESGVSKTIEKTVAKKATTKKTETTVKKSTEIIVNNNIIKTVPNLLTLDQAFEMVSSYFKEIAKEKAEVIDNNNKRTIKFKVIAGGKG